MITLHTAARILLVGLFLLTGCRPALETPSAPVIVEATAVTITQTTVPVTPAATLLPDPTGESPMSPNHPYQVVAYFPEWENRQGYRVKNIASSGSAEKITIINYAFGIPRPSADGTVTCQIDNSQAAYGQVYSAGLSVDGLADDPDQPLRGHFNQLKKLKAIYPHIRVVVSIGGWTGSGWISDAARTAESREQFVRDCLDVWIAGNLPEQNGAGGALSGAGVFDGIDIDWEYPMGSGLPDNHTDPADGANFVLLLQEFRRQYAEIGRPELLLTMAAPGPGQADQYHMAEAHPYLDFVSLMTYDFTGAWSPLASHHTNLCASAQDPAGQPISADRTVRIYRDNFGVPGEKLIIGAAFYGRSWKDVADVDHGLYQPGTGVEGGNGNYRDLIGRLQQGYTRYWDEQAHAPWLYSPTEHTFWSYDDPQSIGFKAQYVRQAGMGGVMFWEITGDDEQGGLVDTIDQELSSQTQVAAPCP